MRLIDKMHVLHPLKGSSRITKDLKQDHGLRVNRQRVRRLMQLMGIQAIYPRPRTSKAGRRLDHTVFPYLLTGVSITAANDVWAADITYIPHGEGLQLLSSHHGCSQPPHPRLSAQ